jgi:hypothetical protein
VEHSFLYLNTIIKCWNKEKILSFAYQRYSMTYVFFFLQRKRWQAWTVLSNMFTTTRNISVAQKTVLARESIGVRWVISTTKTTGNIAKLPCNAQVFAIQSCWSLIPHSHQHEKRHELATTATVREIREDFSSLLETFPESLECFPNFPGRPEFVQVVLSSSRSSWVRRRVVEVVTDAYRFVGDSRVFFSRF